MNIVNKNSHHYYLFTFKRLKKHFFINKTKNVVMGCKNWSKSNLQAGISNCGKRGNFLGMDVVCLLV